MIEAAKIDAPAVRMRARLVKALDPANFAKKMLGRAGAEAIGRQGVCAAQQFKIGVRDNQVEIAGLRADRAVAVEHFERRRDLDGETHRATVAAALKLHSTVTDFARLRG